tara:strand:+ start:13246 stop:14373 length:1128 start_codon:yes stop_codon:yes gene_type:complete
MTAPEVQTDSRANSVVESLAQALGYQVYHKFHNCAVEPDTLRLRCVAAGLDGDCIPDIDPESALKAAVRNFRMTETVQTVIKGKQKTVERARVKAEVVTTTDSEIIIGVLRHERLGARTINKGQTETLIWDRDNKGWTDPGVSEFAETLRKKILHMQTYFDGNEVRAMVVKPALKRAGAFEICAPMYFVPKGGKEELARVQQILDGLDNFRFTVAGIAPGMGMESALQEDAKESMTNDLDKLLEKIEGWEQMSRRVSHKSEQGVFDTFEDLHERAEAYEAALEFKLDDLRERIESMRLRAREAVDTCEAEAVERSGERRKAAAAPAAPLTTAEKVAALSEERVDEAIDALAPGDHVDSTMEEKRAALIPLLEALL